MLNFKVNYKASQIIRGVEIVSVESIRLVLKVRDGLELIAFLRLIGRTEARHDKTQQQQHKHSI